LNRAGCLQLVQPETAEVVSMAEAAFAIDQARPAPPPFGEWLLRQQDRDDEVGALARYLADTRAALVGADVGAVLDHLAREGARHEAAATARAAWVEWNRAGAALPRIHPPPRFDADGRGAP
jgi:hypothetical protein